MEWPYITGSTLESIRSSKAILECMSVTDEARNRPREAAMGAAYLAYALFLRVGVHAYAVAKMIMASSCNPQSASRQKSGQYPWSSQQLPIMVDSVSVPCVGTSSGVRGSQP